MTRFGSPPTPAKKNASTLSAEFAANDPFSRPTVIPPSNGDAAPCSTGPVTLPPPCSLDLRYPWEDALALHRLLASSPDSSETHPADGTLPHDTGFSSETSSPRSTLPTMRLDEPAPEGASLHLPPRYSTLPTLKSDTSGQRHENRLREMRRLFERGEFSRALDAATCVLSLDPHLEEAERYVAWCQQRLRGGTHAVTGSLSSIPRITVSLDQVCGMNLDHRAGFLLSCVDGYSTLEEILDVAGMPASDALAILDDLLEKNVILLGHL